MTSCCTFYPFIVTYLMLWNISQKKKKVPVVTYVTAPPASRPRIAQVKTCRLSCYKETEKALKMFQCQKARLLHNAYVGDFHHCDFSYS